MSDIAIRVENLGKKYILRHHHEGRGYTALRDVLTDKFKRLTTGHSPASAQASQVSREEFWALKNVSFEVKQGEAVGIIGRNGAGKSTLLKLLSRITEPSTGRMELEGRVGSLLEVGTGFHPELTGRENIYLNGSVLGMHRAETRRRFDEIVAFAEVEKFLDTPVKRYSSGMYMRLAFSVAAHLETEVLIVDEVLAVGDAQFQKKCLGKMEKVSTEGGRTVLFVSHNMVAVNRLCPRAILLSAGQIIADGPTREVSVDYQSVAIRGNSHREWNDADSSPGNENCRIRRIRSTDTQNRIGSLFDVTSSVVIELTFDVLREGHKFVPNFHLTNQEGHLLFVAQDLDPEWRGKARPTGRYICQIEIPANLLSDGPISVRVAVTTMEPFVIHCDVRDAITFEMQDRGDSHSARGDYVGSLPGVFRPLLKSRNVYLPIKPMDVLDGI